MQAPTDTRICRFGPFELDFGTRCLSKGGRPLLLSDRELDTLLCLTARAPQTVSKDALVHEAWHRVAVTDNAVVQVIKGLRAKIDDQPGGISCVETVSGRGYRFALPLNWLMPAQAARAALDPYDAFVHGRAALESLHVGAIARAREWFTATIGADPRHAAAHVGLANACLLAFEATRADLEPDRDALAEAERHAYEACRLDATSANAWSTLAVVRHRLGDPADAIRAAQKAVALAPLEWRHDLRLAVVSWGAERLDAAQRVMARRPELALGYWLAATVFVAREEFDIALDLIRSGCAAQDAQRSSTRRFAVVGLHLLHAMVLASRAARISGAAPDVTALADARAELQRELSFEHCGNIYARECSANAWYALGALALRENRHEEACAAFQEAQARVAGHPLATLGLNATSGHLLMVEQDVPQAQTGASAPSPLMSAVDVATVHAAALVLQGRHGEAASRCEAALQRAEPGPSGWQLPIDPLLNVQAHREVWAQALASLHDRAS